MKHSCLLPPPLPLLPSSLSVVRIGFEQTLYVVNEGDGTAEVHVAVLSGSLSSDVVVTLETSNLDAIRKYVSHCGY